jgi:hypothetical protein
LSRRDEETDIEVILSTENGRRFVSRLLERSGIYRSNFPTEPLAMAFREGERSIGLWLRAEVRLIDEAAYKRMINEEKQ